MCVLLALRPDISTAAFERSVFQYTHQRWSEESDAPRPVIAIAQDGRGFLWLATARGLFRFDGFRFEEISAGVDLNVEGPPSALLVRRNGEVWTSFERSRRFAIYRDGRLTLFNTPRAPHRVAAMQESGDGSVWVLTERVGMPLMRFHEGRWTSFGLEAGAPNDNPFSMVVTRAGIVWLSFSGAVVRLDPSRGRFELVRERFRALGRLSIDPQERIWLSEERGTYPITGPGGRGSPPPLRHAYATDAAEIRGWPIFDREGNLWIATYYDGIQHIARPDPRGAATPAEARSRVERFTARDGLASNVTSRMFQDAEGNVWVATENGIDRFWPASLRFEPALTSPAAFGDLLLRASDGSIYIGQSSTIYRVRPGGSPEPVIRPGVEPRTLCEAPDGALWITSRGGGVAIWRGGDLQWMSQPIPLNITVFDCAFDRRGDFWLTSSFGGMARLRGDRWDVMYGPTGPDFIPRSMVTDSRGRLVLQWNDRVLGRLDGTARSSVSLPWDGYQQDDVALYPTSDGTVFAAGRFGLMRLQDDRTRFVAARRMPLLGGVNGIVRTPAGETWLAGRAGVMRLRSADLDRAFVEADYAPAIETFGPNDGLRSRPHDHSRNSIVQGGDGRLWIATQTGTVWLDPTEITRSRTPPAVAISALSADRVYRDPADLTLPAGTANVEIDFAVLNFSNPRAARVRYRIEGQDRDWIDAGTRRQAFYTNLDPGRYRFRLIAANDDGIWNEEGTTLEFVIPPTFVQSRWFLFLCILGVVLLVWAMVRWRYAAAARRLRAVLEERANERERIARDLHDTLLQGVQGLVLSFQAVADRTTRGDADRALLQSALDQADEVIFDGRERVRSLRAHKQDLDLQTVMADLVDASPLDAAVEIATHFQGRPRPLHPYVVEEIVRIGGEALFNIARHAKARTVEIDVSYHRRGVTIAVTDDGVGIPPDVLRAGRREGHYGLIGMRERAERMGGMFEIGSEPGKGARVTLTLAAKLAYVDDGIFGRLRRWFGRKPTPRSIVEQP